MSSVWGGFFWGSEDRQRLVSPVYSGRAQDSRLRLVSPVFSGRAQDSRLRVVSPVYSGAAVRIRGRVISPVLSGNAQVSRLRAVSAIYAGTTSYLEGPLVLPYIKDTENGGAGRSLRETDNVVIANLKRATTGPVDLYSGASTTSISIGGGAAQLELTLKARSSAYNLNDASNTALVTTNQTIVGAINEVAHNSVHVLATVTGIDGKSATATNLYTVPTGKTAIVDRVVLRVTAATAAVGDATADIGVAAGDIVSSQALTGATTVDDAFNLTANSGKFRIADAAEIIKINVNSADTGTALTFSADVLGYLL